MTYYPTYCLVCYEPTEWDSDIGGRPLCQRCWDRDADQQDARRGRPVMLRSKKQAPA